MLNNFASLRGYKLNAIDGELGEVGKFFFDDQHWAIRYLVADTGTWLAGKQVMISPYAISKVIHNGRILSVDLTKKRIQKSPSLKAGLPITGQFEESYHNYYGWPLYWDGPYLWGSYPELIRDPGKWKSPSARTPSWDRHLRGSQEVTGCHVHALDGEVGQVEDVVVDDETWAIRYLVVATRNGWPVKQVLVSPKWIERVNWNESKISINLSCEIIKQSPEYTVETLLNRDYEIGLHRHYDRKEYWADELVAMEHSA